MGCWLHHTRLLLAVETPAREALLSISRPLALPRDPILTHTCSQGKQ